MSDLDLANLSIARAARALRANELSPLELTDAYLRRIERLNPRVNAYLTVTAERAREDARRAGEELAAGKARGPLHGIPIAHKDLYETAGIRTTGGSKIHAEHVPAADCTVARKLREAGTVLLGKLNYARVRLRRHHQQPALRADAQSVGSRAHPGRLERRLGRRDRGRARDRDDRHRHGRQHPHARRRCAASSA